MENIEIINPDDKDYYDGKLYKVGIWPGAGYQLVEFYVYASDESTALDLVVVDAEINAPNLLYSIDEVMNQIADDFQDEYVEFKNEYEDADDFTFAQEYLNYIYVDATMEGASQPYFVNGENLVIEEVQDKVQENKEEIPYDNTTEKECPICHKKYTQFPAVSRRDNKTYICPECGVDEAIEDMLKNKKDENKEIKTEDTNNQHYIAKCTLFDNTTEIPNTYLLLDEKDSEGISGLDIVLVESRFGNLMYNTDYNVKDLEIVKTVYNLTELVNFMKTKGEDLSSMVTDKGIPVGFGDMLPEDLNHYIIGEEGDPTLEESKKVEKINDYEYVIYRQRLTKSPIYVKDYSTETENKDEAITFPTEHEAEEYRDELELSYKEQYKIGVKTESKDNDTIHISKNDDMKEIHTQPGQITGNNVNKMKKQVKTESENNSANIVWEHIEDYSQDEIDEIRNILDDLEVEVVENNGHSVAVKIKSNGMIFWLDYAQEGDDIVGDWNQYIFSTVNSIDRIREAIQTSYFKDTGDTFAFDIMESAGLEYLEKNGVVVYTDEGYRFNDNLKENKEIKKEQIITENTNVIWSNDINDISQEDSDSVWEDFETNILPMIDNQLVDDVLVMSGQYNSNYPEFKKSGIGGELFIGIDKFKDYISEFDTINILNVNNNIGISLADHDGVISGNLYTIPQEEDKKIELLKAMGYDERIQNNYDEADLDKYNHNDLMEVEFSDDLYYGGVDAQDFTTHLNLLVPIKNEFSLTPDDDKLENKQIKESKFNKLSKKMAQKGKKTEIAELGGEYLSNDNVDKYTSGTIYANLDMDIKGVTENDTINVAKEKLQKQADKYDIKVVSVNDSPHGYNVVIKGKLQDICNFTNGSKITIDEYINDYDLYVSKRMAQKGKKTEGLLKEDKQFPITLKNADVIDFKGIPVEVIYNFDSMQEMVNIYVEQTGKSIDVLNKEEIDYNLINTDFSHTTLTKYELIKENENKFYIIEELWGVGDEIGATLYLSNEEIKTTDINDLILQADEASRATLHKQESLLKETNYTFLSPQTIGDYSNGTIEAQSVVNCKDAEDCKNKAKKFKVDVETVEPGETGYIATMKGNLQDICNFIAGKKVNMYDFMKDENTSVMLFKENKIQETNDVKSEFKLKHLCAGCDKDMGFSDKTFCDDCEKNLSDEEKKAAIRKVMGDFTITENKTITEEMTSDEAKQKFINFCEGKVKDLGTIDAKDGNTYKILLTSDSYKQAQPEAYLTQDDDYLIVIDKLGEVVINSDMDTIMTDVGELNFTAIDTELYNEILDNWEDYDLADDFTYRADADSQYIKIKEMAKQLPAEIKYNTIERNGGVDVEMYVDNMPNIKASTTTMKGTEYIQDSFDIDGLWQVSTLDDNGKFNNYEYVTGWQEAVKLMQEQMPKVKKENKELQEDVNEEITLANIKQKAQEILPAEDIDTHYGDLYIKVSDKSTELVNKMKDKDSGLVEIFTSEIDGQQWYDIPFANWNDDYNKLNEAQEGTLSVELNTGVLPIVNVDMYSMGELINDYDVTQEELDEIVMELAPEYIEDTLKDILADVSIVVESVYHPSQYNFSGDELEFTLNVSRSSYESLKETTLQDDKFKSFLKQNYSSYDGFVSYMADSIDDFETQDEWKQVVQVIMFNIPENVIEYNNESYINTFIDKLSSNYPMIEDEDSLDESKKVTENKDKWMEDYEELDGMIIGYLEDHNIKLSKEQQDKVLDDLAVSGILDVFDDFKSNDKIVDKTIESAIKKVTNNLDEKLLGPSDDVIADSKAKGLYTEAQEDKDLDVVNYNITDGGYKNNAETVYGILTDGTYFVYYPEMDLVETYDCEPDELIDILYASEDEMPDEARTEAYNDFFEQHNVNTYTDGPLFDKLHKLYFEDDDSLDESKKVEKKQPMSSNIEKMVSRVEALEKEYDKSNRDMTEKELCADVKKIIEEIYGVKIPDIKLRTILQNGLGYRFKISQNINKYLKEPLDTAITLDVNFSEKTKVDSFTLDPETDLETWGLRDDDRVSFKSNNEDTKVDDSKIYVLVMNNFIYWEGTEEEFDRDDDAAYELAIQNAIADGVEDAYDIDRSDFVLMTKEELKKELKRINAIKDETKEILEKGYKKITEDVNIDDEDSLDESKKVEKKQSMSPNIEKMVSQVAILEKEYDKSNRDVTENELCADVKKIIEDIYGIKIPDIKLTTLLQNGLGYRYKVSQNINKYLKEPLDTAITLKVDFVEKTKVYSFKLDPETSLEIWGFKDDDRVSFKSDDKDSKVDDSKIYVLVMDNFIYWEGTEEEFDRDEDAAYETAIQNAIDDGVEDAYDIDRSDFELMTKEELNKELKNNNAI